MDKILVSACLLGEHCRYDGKEEKNPLIEELNKYYDLVPFCPEVEGGLPTPRIPSEIKSGRVYNKKGENVTKQFNIGAEKALQLCRFLNIHICILKDKSPSCGVYEIYDGTFTNKLKKGQGVTASLLSSVDYWVMSEDDIPELIEKQKKKREIVEERTAAIKAKESGEAPSEEEEASPERPYRSHYEKDDSGERRYSKPRGERSYGEKRGYGERKSYGDRKSYGEHRSYGERKSFGDKPYRKDFHHDGENSSERPFKKSYHRDGERPFHKDFHHDGERPYKKSYGERKSYGDKPYGERKSYGDRKPYGEKRSYGDRKPYGDKKPYGDRKPYGERKSYGDRKPYGEKRSYGDKKPYGNGGFKKSYGGSSGYKKSYGAKKTYKKDADE